jgi:predicted ATPase/GAF domain-containing protein/tRNA A-37 threonylcarbamoyl transferase component Bud32
MVARHFMAFFYTKTAIMLNLPNYQILAPIYESANSLIYRGSRNEDNQPVILKILKQGYSTPAEIIRYRQEYEITHDLNLAGVVGTYGIEKYQNTVVIILEDFGGESLKQLMVQHPLSLLDFLPIAIKIADSLGHIHAAHVIHKDINPSNMVWNSATSQLKIIDFGIASRLARENTTLKNPEKLEGTLAYISPEQTGRINRSIDYRTDLYSLGVTCYEMLSGQLPFEATEAIELIHCHIAKTPIPVCQINSDVPPILSEMVAKLMAKTPEERYQSAFGFKADLEKCLQLVSKSQKTIDFKLAQHDFSSQFKISQKLYGRDTQINTLLKAFERVSNGSAELILVAGYSGVGKTALVREVHKPMTSKNGYFAAGKFDQYQRNIPYSALAQAFNQLCNDLLTESHEQLIGWRDKILKAVGNNGQILIDVINQLELIIGPQTAITQVGSLEAQKRFERVFQNFFRALCQKNHPLVLFIDDLQWADSASLNLLKLLMTDSNSQYFLIIGAYRDNEVNAAHPLMMMVDSIKKDQQLTWHDINLPNLTVQEVNRLISDTLECSADKTRSLARRVYEKTQGNAFFTHEFLKSLYEKGLLVFDINQQQWQWDISKIKALGITDNVVELMAGKIEQLPSNTITVLKLAASIGNHFDLETLSIIYQHSPSDTLAHLWKSLAEGLIEPLDDHYKQVQPDSQVAHFQFQHDRIQQAAYSLIADSDKPHLHQQIGHLMLSAQQQNREERVFEIVDHLNLSLQLVTEPSKKDEIARLNLSAGQKAKAANAYGAAVHYLEIGLNLLAADCWQTDYDFTVQLYVETVEAEYLNAHFEQAETLSNELLQHTENVLEQVKVYQILIQSYMAQNRISEALETAERILALLKIELATSPPQHIKAETCYSLPKMIAPEKLAAMRTLTFSLSPAYTAAPELYPLIVFTMVHLSVNDGNSPFSAYAYGSYAMLLCAIFGDIESGYRFGQLALHILDKFKATEFQTKVLTTLNVVITHWKKPARDSLEPLRDAIQKGLELGDMEYTGIAAMHYGSYTFWVGKPLETVQLELSKYMELMQSIKQEYQLFYLTIWKQLLLNLQGDLQPRLIGDAFNEDESLPILLKNNYGMAIFGIYLAKLMLCYLSKDYPQAIENAKLAAPYQQANSGIMVVPIYQYYYSLALLATYPSASADKQAEIIRQVETHQEQMKHWAFHAPSNYQHRYDLVEAEMARILGQLQAVDAYQRAIQGAREHQYHQDEALAYELAAEFYLGRSMEKIAQTYLQEAYYGYLQWGAMAKVEALEEDYPHWLISTRFESVSTGMTKTVMPSLARTRLNTSTQLDLDSLIKASQTLSKEIVLSQLLEKMIQMVIENAGAERGLLILKKEHSTTTNDFEWAIEAQGAFNIDEVTVLQSVPIEGHLSVTIVNYVSRSGKPLVLGNARQERIYSNDRYIREHQIKSVLCAPIIHQGQLIGLLYLENNQTEDTFTKERIQVVEMLASQTAISLENALLYRTLEQKVEQRTKQLAEANAEINTLNKQLKKENWRMSAELNVAKQIQKMVLPTSSELNKIHELDIACFMEPADEVGGDYYDILEHDGRVQIGIGDVTGHGLEVAC